MKTKNYILKVMFIILLTGFIIYEIGNNPLHSLTIVVAMTFSLVIEVADKSALRKSKVENGN